MKITRVALASLGFLCLAPGLASAEDSMELHPGTPMVLEPHPDSLSFDLGGSETRKLQLQLARPLMLETRSEAYSGASASLLGLGANLNVPLAPGLNLTGGVSQQAGVSGYHSLGSIQCMNGTLRSDSYTASGCRFIDDTSSPSSRFDNRTLSIGLGFDAGNISSSLDWFTSQSGFGSTGIRRFNGYGPAPVFDNRLLTPMPGSALSQTTSSAQLLASEVSGIDLNFEVGFTTDRAGDIQLGLALTRVFDASYSSLYGESIEPMNWNVAEPFNSAMLGIEWSKGSFSSGIRGYYREPVNFLNQNNLQGIETFDVHFTWRTPWNASLSVGASNVLSAGAAESRPTEKPADRFESIYGRIPYVRYQQDL